MKEKMLYTGNNLNVEQICNILDENGIAYEKRKQGADQYLGIAMGSYMFNSSLYVNENELENAKKLIENFIENKDNSEENSKNFEDHTQKSSSTKRIIACCILGVPIILVILAIIKSLI